MLSCGLGRELAAQLVYRGANTIEATVNGLDADHTERSAFFFCICFSGDGSSVEYLGRANDLAAIMTDRPELGYGGHCRLICIDLALAARRIRQRAAEHGIPLESLRRNHRTNRRFSSHYSSGEDW